MKANTPREIAISIRERCRTLRMTPKRIFFEAGVNRYKYVNWRCHEVNPKPDDLDRVYATLSRFEQQRGVRQ